jgi:hypothetical protein
MRQIMRFQMAHPQSNKNAPFYMVGLAISILGTWFAAGPILMSAANDGPISALIVGLFGWLITGSIGGFVATFHLPEEHRNSRFQNVTAFAFLPFLAHCSTMPIV